MYAIRSYYGQSRGALNAFTLDDFAQLAEPVAIQPRLLSPEEKIARWARIWGSLTISTA